MNRIGGETELLEGDGAQERTTSWRSSEEDGRPLPFAESDPHFSHAVDDAFAAGQVCRSLFRGQEPQPDDNLGGKQRIRRASVDEEIEDHGTLSMLEMDQGCRDRERAHARTLPRMSAAVECPQMTTAAPYVC